MPRSRPAPRPETHDFRFFRVVDRPGYGFVVERSAPAVMVVPVAPDGRVYLARIHRPVTGLTGWEVPGGAAEPGEGAVAAALRELEEECGLVAKTARELGPPLEPAPGMGAYPHHLVVARGVVPAGKRPVAQASEGVLSVRRFAPDQLARMCRSGTIAVMPTLVALLRAGLV